MGNYFYYLQRHNKQLDDVVEAIHKKETKNYYNVISPNEYIYKKILLDSGRGNIHQLIKSYCIGCYDKRSLN